MALQAAWDVVRGILVNALVRIVAKRTSKAVIRFHRALALHQLGRLQLHVSNVVHQRRYLRLPFARQVAIAASSDLIRRERIG